MRKERSRLFPQYRNHHVKLVTEPFLTESQSIHNIKDDEKIREGLLREIFSYYQQKELEEPEEEAEPRNSHPELLSTNRVMLFLRDAGIARNPVTQKRAQSIIDAKVRKRRALSLNDFTSVIAELLPL